MPLPSNPNCNPHNRCGKCRRDHVANVRAKFAARATALVEPSAGKICTSCDRDHPLDSYLYRYKGQSRRSAMCDNCRREKSIGEYSKAGTKRAREIYKCSRCPKLVTRRGSRCIDCYNADRTNVVERSPRKLSVDPIAHPCLEGCGMLVSKKNLRCHTCAKLRQDRLAQQSHRGLRVKAMIRMLKSRDVKGVMWVARDEAWALSHTCVDRYEPNKPVRRGCGKVILSNGQCYECSTGRKRTVLRPEERGIMPIDPNEVPPELLRELEALLNTKPGRWVAA